MKRIVLAGNSIVDVIKYIDAFPQKGNLCQIARIVPGVGGCVPNTGIVLKTLAPETLSVAALSRIGRDENGAFIRRELEKRGVDAGGLREDPALPTSFSDVMTLPNGERTFFCAAGANAAFCEEDVPVGSLRCDLFHLGYLLLLSALDLPDARYGTKAAKLLSAVQAQGVRTSIDVVSAEGRRFAETVLPALRYCDYVVINEIEAGRIAGIPLREGHALRTENLRAACESLRRAGVRRTVAIHCPELGCALDAAGNFTVVPSLDLPPSYIAGSVGAGDAFCAGMLYSFANGTGAEEGLRLASCAAACCLHAPDAVSGAKNYAETMALEARFPRRAMPNGEELL